MLPKAKHKWPRQCLKSIAQGIWPLPPSFIVCVLQNLADVHYHYYIGWCLGLGIVAMDLGLLAPELLASVVVQEHQEVRSKVRIIFMYNMSIYIGAFQGRGW